MTMSRDRMLRGPDDYFAVLSKLMRSHCIYSALSIHCSIAFLIDLLQTHIHADILISPNQLLSHLIHPIYISIPKGGEMIIHEFAELELTVCIVIKMVQHSCNAAFTLQQTTVRQGHYKTLNRKKLRCLVGKSFILYTSNTTVRPDKLELFSW